MQPYGYDRHAPSPSQKLMPSQKDPLFSSPFLRRLAAHALTIVTSRSRSQALASYFQ